MKNFVALLCTGLLLLSCKSTRTGGGTVEPPAENTFRIAFGSCNKTEVENLFWDDILALQPDLWIWGGDNIYADTEDMREMREMYRAQKEIPAYRALAAQVPVIGTWDDHDYGLNDGGAEFTARSESEQAFLDFMDVPKDSPRRAREGVYASHTYIRPGGKVKVLVLDTRYFRTPLRTDPSG
ncbi:MAG: alkaline phosphatase D family protein, partial [Robiginitalea sp.]